MEIDLTNKEVAQVAIKPPFNNNRPQGQGQGGGSRGGNKTKKEEALEKSNACRTY